MDSEDTQAEDEVGQARDEPCGAYNLAQNGGRGAPLPYKKEGIMARKEAELKGEFPKLTQGHMDMIARALSYCLSDQYGEDITFRFVPKKQESVG